MCIGVPMHVEKVGSGFESGQAHCRNGDVIEVVDTLLVPDLEPGDWVMVFLGAAREKISAQYAAQCRDALTALNSVMQTGANGSADIDHLFADIINREPELPDFLKDENSPSRQKTQKNVQE